MGKPKTDNQDEANGDIVEENATPSSKESGKKGKKSRKNKDADWEDDVAKELEEMTFEEAGGTREKSPEPEPLPDKKEKKKEKKSKKSKAKDNEDDDDEVVLTVKKGGGFAALMLDDDDDDDDDEVNGGGDDDIEEPVVEKKEKTKNKRDDKPKKPVEKSADSDEEEELLVKTKKGGGFAALMDDDDDDDFNDDDDDEPVVEEKKEVKKKNKKKDEKPKPAVEDKKKGKKGKKKKNDDEDLDQILAELQLEYQGEKPNEEPAKDVTEDPPPPAEESSKKKKKKKKESAAEPEKDEAPASSAENAEAAKPTTEVKKEIAEEKMEAKDTPSEVVLKVAVEEKPVKEAKDGSEAKITPEAEVKITPEAEVNDIPETEANDIPETEANDIPETEANDKPETEANDKPETEANDKPEAETPAKSKKKKKKTKDSAAATGEDSKEGTPAPEGKKKKDAEKDDKARKGKPSNKALAVMREILAKQKEEEERQMKEAEEKQREEDEKLKQLEEEKRLDQEKRERRKLKEKERKERLKAEGKLLTPKQKADMKRAQEMIEHRKAMGLVVPEVGEKKPRPGTRIKPKKNKKDEDTPPPQEVVPETVIVVEEKPQEEVAPAVEEVEEVKDAWDESSDEDDEDTSEATKNNADNDEDDDDDDDDDESGDSESDEEIHEEHRGEAEKRKQRALDRMAKRKEENLKKLDPEVLRAPVVCVLGHVDHGKTKILDKLRKSNVQEGEVGGITQQIGATNVPAYAIKKQTHMVKDFDMDNLNFPGLLIIDTPGHESFRNLRSRGSSLCDIAILVIDITQGLEPQTRESVSLLRNRSTPFVVALNKVDRVYEWLSNPSKDIREIITTQEEPTKNDFERRTSQAIQGLREEKLNSALFWENPNPKEYISLIPTSAISGDGMGNLMSLICNLCQQRLKKNLMFSEELQCTVLEVKTIQGHGTTIDVILVNGRLREGDTIIVAGTEGPIVTQIRSLLLPKPLKEIRVKGQYDEVKEIAAAQGVKIAARDLEKAIPGLTLKVAYHEDEIEILKDIVDREFTSAMRSMKVKERGVVVQASTLGALEALLEFFKTNNVPYSGIRVGAVVKRDVMRAAAMLEHDPMYAVILAFDVKVEKDAQDLADKEGVKIFSEETIYHLGDRYVEYLKDYKKKKQDEFRHIAVFPSRLRIIPTAVFNKRDPIVLGVNIEAGVLRTGTPLCVPSKEFVEIGIVTSMEFDHKNVDSAKKGDEVCIKIENVPGHTPKLIGRHFEPEDQLVSKISRESINACKDYFRDDLGKPEWKLMIELKKQFQIL